MFAAVVLGAWVAACVGDDPGASGPGDTGADGGPGGGGDGSVMPGTDGSVGPGTDGDSDAATCTAAACVDNGASLSCGGGPKTACTYGCAPATGATAAHCRVFDPTGSVEPTDLTQAGLMDFSGTDLKFFTDTGRITSADEATEIRPANATATVEEVSANGIGFRLVAGKLGIFQFKNFTLQASQSFDFTGASGTVALAIVAAEEVKINGVLDVGCSFHPLHGYPPAGSFPGSGTPADAKTQLNGMGPGGGKAGGKSAASGGYLVSGGGGAGHGAAGGQGGDGIYQTEAVVFGGAGGAFYDDTPFDPPLGGAGGGSGGHTTGGAGGGAVQIVAGVRITIGSGPDGGAGIQGINAGGCGGGDGFNGPAAGGGAGGTILLEAPEVVGKANAGVASNGGGGGGPGSMSSNGPQNGSITTTPAQGEIGVDCSSGAVQAFGGGGTGGAGATPNGGKGGFPAGTGPSTATRYGGGGGGAAGRVRILTVSGDITADPSFVISPSVTPSFQKAKIATR